MKRLVFILISVICVFVFSACDSNTKGETESVATSPSKDCKELAQKTIDVINQYENGARPDGNSSQDAIDYYNKAFSSCSSILDRLDEKGLRKIQEDNELDYKIYADYLSVHNNLITLFNAEHNNTSIDRTETYLEIIACKKELKEIIE